RFSTDIIGSCAFGLDCNSFEEPNSPFRVYGKKVFRPTALDQINILISFSFPNLARILGIRIVKKDVSDFFIKVVEDTISYREKNNVSRNDFMQLLLEMKNKDGDVS
ncbi:cytochrome P450 6a2-like, partial [Anoplophora glabripennis]|uniref:cytochrome P450 6a2-like n=2 Tax=Anoplophora glabripennis TaxID=217634 RepID=UPI000873FBE7